MTKIKAAVSKRIVPKWYRKWSIQLSAFFLVLSAAIMATPADYLSWMPEWVKPLAFVVIIIAGVIKQKDVPGAK